MTLEEMRLLRNSIERAANFLHLSQSAGPGHPKQESYLFEAMDALNRATRHLHALLNKLHIPDGDAARTSAETSRKNLSVVK